MTSTAVRPEPIDAAIRIESEADIVASRRIVREAAMALGFGVTDVTRIVTASSELTRNIFRYAGSGEMRLRSIMQADGPGIELVFEDRGPGIADLEGAMKVGFSTSGGLGLGLPGTKRLMDEMQIDSEVGRGTTVTVRKWLR